MTELLRVGAGDETAVVPLLPPSVSVLLFRGLLRVVYARQKVYDG